MNIKRDTPSATNSMSVRFHRRIGPARLTLPAVLALGLTMSARGETPFTAIPFSGIGARATATYQGDALGVTATADGARLRCGFQKLEGHATPEGLWLQSTKPGGGQLRLVAVTVGRDGSHACPCALTEAASSVRSGMSIVTVPRGDQAPLGATCTYWAASLLDMPLLTELETTFSDVPFSALGRAGLSTLNSQPSTVLATTGTVSMDDKLVRFTRPGLTEEYSMSVDGVRQDFIIESPPLNPQPSTLNQSMRVELALSGARAEATASGARLTLEGSGRALAYSRLRVEDATGRELTARLEVLSPDRLAVSVADANATYPVRIDPTFSDAHWVSLNPGVPGANGAYVFACAVDASGNVYVGGDFSLVGTVPANHIAKWDGSAWSALGSGINGVVYGLAVSGTNLYAGGDFMGAGGVWANHIANWDGSTWSALGSGVNSTVFPLAVSGTNLYAGGEFATAGGVPVNNIAKWDGSAWAALGSGVNGIVGALAVRGTNLYVGGQFTTAGGVPASYIAKWDGSAWSALGSGMGGLAYPNVGALAVSGTDLYAGGNFTTAGGVAANYIAKWNGSAWSALGSGLDYTVNALTVSGTNLYAGGGFTKAGGVTANGIAKWNGSTWSALSSGMNGVVFALAASGTDLFAAGYFTTASGLTANRIAKWDGSAWSALGSGMNGYVRALAVSGTGLYVGGAFTTASAVPAKYIAKWGGSTWSALGSGMDSNVYALAVSGTDLYAGGLFTTAGGVPANCIAKWDGRTWSALGSGVNSNVYALAVSGTNLYVGGAFTTAGGVPANYIAKWDGSTWSALGSGMNGGVEALAVSGTNLYAGGSFTTAGGLTANCIAKWNSSAWSPLGSGMGGAPDPSVPPDVRALAVTGTDLYAGGYFTTAGGVGANRIAKWNGSAWSALGSGMDWTVEALAVSWANLYAGGAFTTAGGTTVNYIAKWDGSAWSALGSGMDGSVTALAADGAKRLFVGGTFYFAGTNVSPCIAEGILASAPTSGPPVIVASSVSLAVPIGATADFQVEAAGSPPLAYQWVFKGMTVIAGATSASLSLTNVQLTQAGAYSVTVTNLYGAVTSAPAVLTVTGVPPVIVASPASLPVLVGATADFQVEATGSPPLAYQWVFNGSTAIAGATGSVLSLTNVQATQAGIYSVTVTNLYGAVTSAPALLQVFAGTGGVVANCTEAALRAAMAEGGTVTFACDGTITLASTITNAADTSLDASGHQITISGNGAVRVFYVNSNVDFTLINLTVANGSCSDTLGGAGIFNGGGTVNAISVAFASNSVVRTNDYANHYAQGGAVGNGGTLNLQNCSFTGNSALSVGPTVAAGGAIYSSGMLNAGGCVFSRNSASSVPMGPTNLGGWQGTIYQAGGSTAGGALANEGIAVIEGSTFSGNVASGGAGLFAYTTLGAVDAPAGGTANGGAIYNEGELTVRASSFLGNKTQGGNGAGGGDANGHPMRGGTGGAGGDARGAAVCGSIQAGFTVLVNCTIAQNSAVGGGGGAGGDGGFSESGGSGGGGGSAGEAVFGWLTNCTVAWNTGQGGSGGHGGATNGAARGAIAGQCVNTIIAYNSPLNCSGAIGDAGHNLSSDASCAFTSSGSMNNTDPKLGLLSDNGGPTLTMALLPGSPAIDAGDTSLAPPTDQRGFTRPAGLAADIGAYEYGVGPPLVSTLPATGVSTNSATLNGTVNPNGWPTTDWFQWGATTNYGNLTSVTALGSGTNALPLFVPLAGLSPSVTYHFRVSATNHYGLVYGSDQNFTTMGPPLVSTLPATDVSTDSATLKGTVNPNGYPTSAWFQWGATTNYGHLTPVTDLGSGTTALPLFAPLDGLIPGIDYHFRVAATNDYGLVHGSDQSFTTLGPPLVSTLPATGVSSTSATLNGTVNPKGYPATAWFQWGATTSYGNLTSVTNLGSGTAALPLSAPLAALAPSVTYHFRVAATNDYELVYGSDQSFTTESFEAEFNYAITNDMVTITGYTGPGGAVTIPSTINGLPVASIGDHVFYQCTNLTSVTIPDGVTRIGGYAFFHCTGLASITIPNSVTRIEVEAFDGCGSLTTVTIPNSVTDIGDAAFFNCWGLTSVTIGNGVTSIADYAFAFCFNLPAFHFGGNCPNLGGLDVFANNSATVYYLPGTTGWGTRLGGRPTALWFLSNPLILSSGPGFGVQSNAFGFIISWATNLPVVVEACTNLANHSWSPVKTNTLTGGWSYFSDPQWTNYPGRFYRVRWP